MCIRCLFYQVLMLLGYACTYGRLDRDRVGLVQARVGAMIGLCFRARLCRTDMFEERRKERKERQEILRFIKQI